MNSASNRIAIVTGAGSGIGAAVSLGLARNGFTVALAGRRFAALEAVAADIAGAGGVALPVSTDVGDENSVAALFERVRERFGRVDLLFNNAGSNARAAPLEELTADEWHSVLRVNLTGAFLCTQQAIRMMKAQQPRGGRIINNGSVSATTPRPHSAPYAAAKHGLTGLTKATALEGRPYDIACGQIDIGNVATSLGAHIAAGTLQSDGSIAREPMMDVRHIVDAVSYMAGLPLDANVLFMTVMATRMPMVGRG